MSVQRSYLPGVFASLILGVGVGLISHFGFDATAENSIIFAVSAFVVSFITSISVISHLNQRARFSAKYTPSTPSVELTPPLVKRAFV